MTIFITGATGFVGRHVVRYFLHHQPNTPLVCLVRDPAKAAAQWPDAPANLTWLTGDLLNPDSYKRTLAQARYVFHIAALVSLKDDPEFYTMNTEATRCLTDALADSTQLQRLVFVSSISAVDRPLSQRATGPLTEQSEPHPNTDYGRSKRLAEEQVIASGLPYTILRPPYIHGSEPRPNSSMDRLVQHVKAGKRYTRFPFPGRVSEVYVEDLADMMWVAAQHPNTLNEVFFVSNPEPVNVADAFRDVAMALNTPDASPFAHRALSSRDIARTHQWLLRRQPTDLVTRILFEDFFLCSPEKWYAHTGYQPRYGYREGVRRTLHALQQATQQPT